jgi:hydroxylamine dehydrogenase
MLAVRMSLPAVALCMLFATGPAHAAPRSKPVDRTCVDCHAKVTPAAVTDWKLSRHAAKGVGCATCHGTAHSSAADAGKALVADAETCARCHEARVKQFASGLHGFAWKTVAALPPEFLPPGMPRVFIEGAKGCGGCHVFGMKSAEEKALLRANKSHRQGGSCDACHTRHTFSAEEARQPQACQTCHQGDDHQNYAIWEGSKHGVRARLVQTGHLPKGASAPTCQTCHMPGGDHEVVTAWGMNALRLPVEEKGDPQWTADRIAIMQGFGMLDQKGNPTPVLDGVTQLKWIRPTREAWQKARDKMVVACSHCHSASFARDELEKGDRIVRESDRVMAEALRVVNALYDDGIVKPTKYFPTPVAHMITYPEDDQNSAEALLRELFLDHRSKTWMGAFHNNPEFPYWMGYNRMQTVLYEIKEKAVELRKEKAAKVAERR